MLSEPVGQARAAFGPAGIAVLVFELFKYAALLLVGAASFALAAHYMLEAAACFRAVRTRQSFVRETELDEWLVVLGLSLGSPFLVHVTAEGVFRLATEPLRGLTEMSIGVLTLGYLVVTGRRRWLHAPSLSLYGFSGSGVGKHIEDGMALEWAAVRRITREGNGEVGNVTSAFPGLHIQDGGALGLTVIRGKGNWRGHDNLKGALLKRVIQTNLLCIQTLKAEFLGLWVTAIFSLACGVTVIGAYGWLVYILIFQLH